LNVLKGAKKTLKELKSGSRLIIEVWEQHEKEVLKHMKKSGFKYERISESDFLFTKI